MEGTPPTLRAGPSPSAATAGVLLVHGRGGEAAEMLLLARHLELPGVTFVAPQAAGGSWYPHRFLAPLADNEPWLGSSLARLESELDELAAAGLPRERVMLVGFSQGACLSLELVARHARRYGAVAGLTGGLIGPPGTPRDYPGNLAGTPVLLAAGDPDPHVPWTRVEETAAVLGAMGAEVILQRYPGRPHTVSADELAATRRLLARLVAGS